jgi:hypothetical protein
VKIDVGDRHNDFGRRVHVRTLSEARDTMQPVDNKRAAATQPRDTYFWREQDHP